MINTVDVFMPYNGKREKINIKSALSENKHSPWPIHLRIDSIQFYMTQAMLIKFKNEILSIDRQFNERRKNATVSKRS